MMSDSHEQSRKNSGDNDFRGIPVAGDEPALFAQFLDAHDLAPNSRRAFGQDMRKFAQWFTTANREPLALNRVTVRDITDISGFHAHIYFDPATRDTAARLRDAMPGRFTAKVGRWHEQPIGPHTKGMYQVAFAPDQFAAFVSWLMLNRDGLSILVHPMTGDDVAEEDLAFVGWIAGVLDDVNVRDELQTALLARGDLLVVLITGCPQSRVVFGYGIILGLHRQPSAA